MLASKRNGTLLSNIVKRVWEHKNNVVEGFTKRYGVHTLVWYEPHQSIENAIEREKIIKKWNRKWKLDLIERSNPEWNDLFQSLI